LYGQQALCAQVVEAGGDYLVIVKGNKPTLLAAIVQVFTPLTAEEQARRGIHTVHPLPIQGYRTVEKGHGQLEERHIRVSSELAGYSTWLCTPTSGTIPARFGGSVGTSPFGSPVGRVTND
jgi:hypothetical protein